MKYKPQYPVYIISKGRYENCLTAKCFINDKVNFKIVVEPQEQEEYAKKYNKKRILVLPFSNLGLGGMPARNWIWKYSESLGYKRHWIFDDNIKSFGRLNKGKRIPCNSNIGMKVIEDFTDRYENIAISGFNYRFFVPNDKLTPFTLNCHVYSALLIFNDMTHRWRMKYNEDTDLCLQVLTNNLCTVLFHAFFCDKMATMTMKGGNTNQLYKKDGRLKMARSLEAMWPQYVKTKWRFGRPQHVVKNSWKDFKNPLIRRKDINWSKLKSKQYEIKLVKTKEIKSKELKKFYKKNKLKCK